MKAPLVLVLAASLAASTSVPALAQTYAQDREYQRRMDDYYAQQREYERRWAEYERARADYDRRYGYGAYARYYAAPVAPRPYDTRDYAYGYGGPIDDPSIYYSSSPCERRYAPSNRDSNMFAGGLIGALAGAAIGSNLADRGNRDEGAVLGAFAGAALGIGIAGSNSNSSRYNAQCDNAGYYYNYAQTYPYQEPRDAYGSRSGRYDRTYYERQRCRLAVAPAYYNGRTDYRYVRVCPDRNNRYRITN